MNDLWTIIRYTPNKFHILYSSTGNEPDFLDQLNQNLFHFIESEIENAFTNQQPFYKQYSTLEHFFIVHFIPEKEETTKIQQVLVVVQATEKLVLDKQDITSFTSNLKLFFRKGVHDMKNLFSNITVLLQGNGIEKARSYLAELQDYYLKQIEGFYEALDAYTNIEKAAPPQIKVINIQTIITDVISQYPSLLKENATLEADFQACPQIAYREDYLLNMIKSLIDNAIQYRVEGQPLHIRMRTEKKEDKVAFLIEDNGIGIDTNHYKDKLFMPFQRFTRQSNGQGISLHLVKLMIEKNGGSIELKSALHQGTQVTLLLKEYVII